MSKKADKPVEVEEDTQLHYHSVETLVGMTAEAVKKLYDMVPSERQERYRAVYDAALLDAGAKGSDENEYEVAKHLLGLYQIEHRIPIGMRWAIPPSHVQEAVINNADLVTPEATLKKGKGGEKGPNPIVAIGFGVAIVVAAFLLIFKPSGGKPAKVAMAGTETTTPSPTPLISPTPTPLAIENIDDVVSKGEPGGQSFPIKLTVQNSGDTQPRIYVVQRRAIKLADWKYTDDPGTASFISGLAVRPIIGIPYSDDNKVLFANIAEGSLFQIVTNTGATLSFDYSSRTQVQRTDTSIFGQNGPGIILILIGEHDPDTGLPTQFRTVITASYNPTQELTTNNIISNSAMQVRSYPTATPSMTPTPIRRTTLNLIDVRYKDDFLEVRARLINVREEPITVTGDMIWVAYGYAPNPSDPRNPTEKMPSFTVLPGQAADLDVYFKYTGREPYAEFGIGSNDEWKFGVQIKNPGSQ